MKKILFFAIWLVIIDYEKCASSTLLERKPQELTVQEKLHRSLIQELTKKSEEISIDVVKDLLDQGAPINASEDRLSGTKGMNALLWAINSGREDVVSFLLDRGADPRLSTEHGDTPLIAAAVLNQCLVLDKLLQFGVSLKDRDISGRTALMRAMLKEESPEAVSILEKAQHILDNELIAKINENSLTREILADLMQRGVNTAPLWSSIEKKPQLAQDLNLLQKDEIVKHMDLASCNLDFAKAMVSVAGDTCLKNKNGQTALMLMCMDGCADTIKFVLNSPYKQCIDVQDNKGRTALMIACYLGYQNIVEILLTFGSDPSIRDYRGDSILKYTKGYFSIDDILKKIAKSKQIDDRPQQPELVRLPEVPQPLSAALPAAPKNSFTVQSTRNNGGRLTRK